MDSVERHRKRHLSVIRLCDQQLQCRVDPNNWLCLQEGDETSGPQDARRVRSLLGEFFLDRNHLKWGQDVTSFMSRGRP